MSEKDVQVPQEYIDRVRSTGGTAEPFTHLVLLDVNQFSRLTSEALRVYSDSLLMRRGLDPHAASTNAKKTVGDLYYAQLVEIFESQPILDSAHNTLESWRITDEDRSKIPFIQQVAQIDPLVVSNPFLDSIGFNKTNKGNALRTAINTFYDTLRDLNLPQDLQQFALMGAYVNQLRNYIVSSVHHRFFGVVNTASHRIERITEQTDRTEISELAEHLVPHILLDERLNNHLEVNFKNFFSDTEQNRLLFGLAIAISRSQYGPRNKTRVDDLRREIFSDLLSRGRQRCSYELLGSIAATAEQKAVPEWVVRRLDLPKHRLTQVDQGSDDFDEAAFWAIADQYSYTPIRTTGLNSFNSEIKPPEPDELSITDRITSLLQSEIFQPFVLTNEKGIEFRITRFDGEKVFYTVVIPQGVNSQLRAGSKAHKIKSFMELMVEGQKINKIIGDADEEE